jgi:hypothetical protein
MKTEIFYYGGSQLATANKLRDQLRLHIYSDLDPTIINVAVYQAEQLAWRYVKLLKAAIPDDKLIGLDIRETPLLKNLTTAEYASPTPYVSHVERRVVTRVILQESFFPALAMRDRMVLVPKGSMRILEATVSAGSSLKALQMRVEEVDLEDNSELRKVLIRLGKKLGDEAIKDLRAYAKNRSIDRGDLSKTAKDLGLEVEFLRRLCADLPRKGQRTRSD